MKPGWRNRKKGSGQHRRALDAKDDTERSVGRNGKAPQILSKSLVQRE